MNQVDNIDFVASEEILRRCYDKREIPESLLAPFQALIRPILKMADGKPVSVYLLSSEGIRDIRNFFAYALAKTLVEHIPSTVLIDFDFMNTGMSGILPHKDALGFLDFLLYGSSLSVVTQELPQGVKAIGAGSFPVTKVMPVSSESFSEAERRLVSQSHLAIFCGPDKDDDGNVHPIAEMVDIPIVVQSAPRFPPGKIDPFVEKLAALCERQVVNVQISSSGAELEAKEKPAAVPESKEAARPIPEEEAPSGKVMPVVGPEIGETAVGSTETAGEDTSNDKVKAAPEAAFSDYRFDREKDGSIFPKVATTIIAVALIIFLFWWLFLTKHIRKTGDFSELAATDTVGLPVESTTTGPISADSSEGTEMETQGEAIKTASDKEEEAAPDEVYITSDITEYGGKYLIHISSFREIERAIEDATFLLRNGFPACIVSVDLGTKGEWFRVYSGPFETREEAREQKLHLEDLPGVAFTRIKKAPVFK